MSEQTRERWLRCIRCGRPFVGSLVGVPFCQPCWDGPSLLGPIEEEPAVPLDRIKRARNDPMLPGFS